MAHLLRPAREAAQKLLNTVWRRRHALGIAPATSPPELFPLALDVIVTEIFGYEVDYPNALESRSHYSEAAGELDRANKVIRVASKFSAPVQRFTLAHEIGHMVLHKGLLQHRDMPIMGADSDFRPEVPLIEMQANAFAAELLMPRATVRNAFLGLFGQPVDRNYPVDELATRLSDGTGHFYTPAQLLRGDAAWLSLLAARATSLPLHMLFGVSATAMALRLRDLGLVSDLSKLAPPLPGSVDSRDVTRPIRRPPRFPPRHISSREPVASRSRSLPDSTADRRAEKRSRSDARSPREGSSRGKLKKSVFIVHGHDSHAIEATARVIENMGLEAVILKELAHSTRSIMEHLLAQDVDYAVILMTADDLGRGKSEKGILSGRARQNVVLELGLFIGKIGRERVCILCDDDVEIPSDLDGILRVNLDKDGAWKPKLRAEITAAGLKKPRRSF